MSARTENASFRVNAGGGFSYLARVKNHAGSDITQATTTSISRTITNTVSGVAVTDAITVATAVLDTPVTNATLWSQAYNFKDDIPSTKVTERVRHTLQYTFTPTSGSVFKTKEMDIEGD